MPNDKERAETIRKLCEALFMRTCVLQALVEESGLANWSDRLDKTLNSEAANYLREDFRALYEQSLEITDQAAFLDFLKKAKIFGKVQ